MSKKIVIYNPKNKDFLCDKRNCTWGGFGVEHPFSETWNGKINPDEYLPFGGFLDEDGTFDNKEEAVEYAKDRLKHCMDEHLMVLEMENHTEQRVVDGVVVAEYPVMKLNVLEDVKVSWRNSVDPLEMEIAEMMFWRRSYFASASLPSMVYFARDILEVIKKHKENA